MVGRALAFAGRALTLARFGAANALLNAFTNALQVPNALFTVAGTALSTVMIPVYSGLLAKDKSDEARGFINNVISVAMVLLAGLTLLGVLGAPLIARVVGGAAFEEAAFLIFALRAMMPVMLFFGLGAIFTGLLQSHGVFRLPALVSAPGGLLLIGYMLLGWQRFGVQGLVFVTITGVVLQPLLLVNAVRKLGIQYRFSINLRDAHLRAAGRLCMPVLVSVVAYQAHFLFAHSVALRQGAAAVMDFSQQLVQVAGMILVLAVAQVYLPKLSALWAKNDHQGYNDALRGAFTYVIFLVLPAAAGIFLLRAEIMTLLGIHAGADLVGLYAIGIAFVALREIADRGFYARQEARTPAAFGVLMMAINITAVLLLVPRLGIQGIPIAYGLAAFISAGGLLIFLQQKTRFITSAFLYDLGKILLAAAFMAAVAWAAQVLFRESLNWENPLAAAAFPATLGAASYLSVARMLKINVGVR